MSNVYGASSPGYASYGSPADQAARLAAAQLQEGSSTAPIRAKSQGYARLAQALMGGLGMRQQQQGAMDSNAAALKLAGAMSGGGMAAGGGGTPAAPGALADLQNATADTPNLTNADFSGLQDSDIMGQGPQMGPPQAAMAPNGAAGGVNPGGPAPGSALPAGGAGGGVGQGAMMGMNGMPPQGVQVASNDPNFMPSFPQPSPANASGGGNGAIAQPPAPGGQFSPDDLAMLQGDEQGTSGASPQGGGGSLDQLKANIAQTESGGNYGATGPVTKSGDRAYGKYQVMGNNIPQWTQQVLGQSMTPEQFLQSPQAQEAVATAKLGSYMAQNGPAGAAREWFTGSPTGTGSDGNMDADKYAALATKGMGGGNAFLHNSVAGPGAPSSVIGSPPPQNDQQMFAQDQQGSAQGSDQGGQGSGIPPQVMDGVKQILMNPYASPEAKQMAQGVLQKYIQPQWETVNRPDGSVIAINKNNPSQNRMVAQPVRPSSFTQIGTDASGNPRYGFVNPATGQIEPADQQSGAPSSPYVPRTGGAPAPAQAASGGAPNIPPPNPAWTPQGGQPQAQGASPAATPNSIASPDYTVRQTPGELAINQMAANDPNPANASLYTRARNIMLGNEPAPLLGVAGTKPVDVNTMNIVRQADPNFNPAVATMRADVIKNWQDKTNPNSQGGQLYAANGSLAHLNDLKDASDDLAAGQSNIQDLNALQGWASKDNLPFSGGTAMAAKRAAYQAAMEPVAGELTKLYSGGPGTEGERDQVLASLSPDAPPAARDAAMAKLSQLLGDKVDKLGNQWTQAGFASPFPALDQKSQNALTRFQNVQQGQGSGQGQIPGQPQAQAPQQAPAGGGDVLSQARAAISKGAPRAAVLQRLQQMGVNPAGL